MLLLQFHGSFPPSYKQAFLQHSKPSGLPLEPKSKQDGGLNLIPGVNCPQTNTHRRGRLERITCPISCYM
jgi:hypothetical protein